MWQENIKSSYNLSYFVHCSALPFIFFHTTKASLGEDQIGSMYPFVYMCGMPTACQAFRGKTAIKP